MSQKTPRQAATCKTSMAPLAIGFLQERLCQGHWSHIPGSPVQVEAGSLVQHVLKKSNYVKMITEKESRPGHYPGQS